jgi:hypothetical protein
MCITSEPAILSNTILYSGETMMNGKVVHVLGYQNNAKNLHSGPNAMILPFPSSGTMGPENVIDTSRCKDILKDYADALQPRTRGMTKSLSLNSYSADAVQVFESGSYTVVLATDASQIPAALARVPKNRRPALKPELFEFMSRAYPNWPIALCCFDTTEMMEADPMLWWYEPNNPDVLWAPALDAHDGGVPKLGTNVQVDHTVIFGSTIRPKGVNVNEHNDLPTEVAAYVASHIQGRIIKQKEPNGDFMLKKADLQRPHNYGRLNGLKRWTPELAA